MCRNSHPRLRQKIYLRNKIKRKCSTHTLTRNKIIKQLNINCLVNMFGSRQFSHFTNEKHMWMCRSGQTGQTQNLIAQCLPRFESQHPHLFLELCSSSSVWIEHQVPNLVVIGSNPISGICAVVKQHLKFDLNLGVKSRATSRKTK